MLTVFSPNANTYPPRGHLTNSNLLHSQKANRNDFHGPLEQALPFPSRVSLAFGNEDIMALIGKVEEFQENYNWIEYMERLEYYCTKMKLPTPGRKQQSY